MKHVKLFEEFISEKTIFATSRINGNEITSEWAGESDNEKDFIKMIENLPETLQRISVVSSTHAFSPSREEFKGPITPQIKSKIIKIVKRVTKEFKAEGDPITSYHLRSYFGVSSPERHNTDPAYIQYSTQALTKFADDMSSGKYGRLD